jgi:hypothetical protein
VPQHKQLEQADKIQLIKTAYALCHYLNKVYQLDTKVVILLCYGYNQTEVAHCQHLPRKKGLAHPSTQLRSRYPERLCQLLV